MKFKSVFIFFTAIILVFLVFVTLIPFLMFEQSTALLFWRSNWPFILLLALILGGIDGFYLINRRLFSLLEREDWPALVDYLEGEVIRRGKYRSRQVKLLANAYLVLSDPQGVIRLENRVAAVKPSLLGEHALVFGAARLLGRDYAGAARFFAERLEGEGRGGGKPRLQWIRWYRGFALFLDHEFSPAADIFIPMTWDSPDAVLAGLSAYFLTGAIRRALGERRQELEEAAARGRERVRRRFPRVEQWKKECARLRDEIYGAVLAQYLDEAGNWLYI